jgi:hypothetical protein
LLLFANAAAVLGQQSFDGAKKGHATLMPITHAATFRRSLNRRLGAASLLAGLITCVVVANASAAAPSAQPAELQALEQRMSELTITSERVTGKEAIGGKLPRKLAALSALSTEFSGEESISPAFANVNVKLAGRSLTVLRIGETLYTRDPAIARHDGGRPWVQESLTGKSGLFGAKPSLGGGGVGGSSAPDPTPYKSDAELFKAGTEVRALGASTVDGQATVGFAGTLTAHKLAESELTKKQIGNLAHDHVKLKGSFEAFIAANGVPVRTSVVLSIGKLRLSVSADVLAIDFPVTIPAPPAAAETIGAAELEKLEKARLKRLLKKKHK